AGRSRSVRQPRQIARDHVLDLGDRGSLRIDVVGDDPAAAHDDDAIDHLEDVMDIVSDEDAGVARIARVAHEAQDALRRRGEPEKMFFARTSPTRVTDDSEVIDLAMEGFP